MGRSVETVRYTLKQFDQDHPEVAVFPNATGPLAVLKFRDGTQRNIMPAELISGRCIEQLCRAARQAAAFREVDGGEPGLTLRELAVGRRPVGAGHDRGGQVGMDDDG